MPFTESYFKPFLDAEEGCQLPLRQEAILSLGGSLQGAEEGCVPYRVPSLPGGGRRVTPGKLAGPWWLLGAPDMTVDCWKLSVSSWFSTLGCLSDHSGR